MARDCLVTRLPVPITRASDFDDRGPIYNFMAMSGVDLSMPLATNPGRGMEDPHKTRSPEQGDVLSYPAPAVAGRGPDHPVQIRPV